MNGKRVWGILTAALALLLMMVPALAESLPSDGPAIMLDGRVVEEAVLNLSEGNVLQFSATEPVVWKSSKTYRGVIDENGLFTSITAGTLNITATAQDGREAVCKVRMARLVTGISITGDSEMLAGERITLKASARPSDAAERGVVWSSSDERIASVNSYGRVTAKSVNEAATVVISATAADGSGVAAQHVITVKPTAKSVSICREGEAVREILLDISGNPVVQLTAQVLPADAPQNVKWKSGASCVSVDQNGVITGKKTGTATITATAADGSGRKTTVKVRVVRMVTGIDISGVSGLLGGKSTTLKAEVHPSNATEKQIVWTSSDPSVLTVNEKGRVSAAAGAGMRSAVITAAATDGSGVIAQHTITVTPPIQSMSIAVDGEAVNTVVVDMEYPEVRLEALILPAEAGQDVKWTADSTSRVKIQSDGTVTALRTGKVYVTAAAQDGSGKKAVVELKIIRAVRLIEVSGDVALAGGARGQLKAKVLPSNATESGVTWESSDPELLSVSKYGEIRAAEVDSVRQVTVYARAKDGSGVVGSAQITITPVVRSVAVLLDGAEADEALIDLNAGSTLQLGALVEPADALSKIRWTSSASGYASVDENGLVTAKRTGTVSITANSTDGSGKKAVIKIRIARAVQSISVSGEDEIIGGQEAKLKVSVLPANATNDDVTWESSDPELLSVNKYGTIKAAKTDVIRQATVTARAKDGSGVSGSMTVTIVPAAKNVVILADGRETESIVMDISSMPTLQLSARIEPSDARQDIRWVSSNTNTAKVDAEGVLHAYRTGTVTVTAYSRDGSGVKETLKVKVIRAVQSIGITGEAQTVSGREGKLKASVLPSNATNKEVTWESSDAALLSINKYGSYTVGKTDSIRQVTVYARAKDGSGVVGSIDITIIPKAARMSVLRDGQPVENVGIDLAGTKVLQLSALIEPADALKDVKWVSSSASRAKVDQNGLVTALSAGTTTITASAKDGSGVKAKVTVNVGYMVKQITIVGASEVTGGRTIELSTRIAPSNATKKSVVWSSSDETVARVNSDGEVTAAKVNEPKQVTITATAKDGGGAAAEHVLTVIPAAASVSLERTDGSMGGALFLNNGQSAQLTAVVSPAAASQKVTWSSSDRDIVTVTADGLVTAHDTGRTTLVARAADGSGVKAVLWVGVGDLSQKPYYFEVDIANQVVRVYERGEDNSYTKLIKRMICSTGRSSTPGLAEGLYSLNGSRMVWMVSVTDTYAIYATRIQGHFLFHSVPYPTRSMSDLDANAYRKLGSKASAGCVRLVAGDAKWIYDNAPKGCFVRFLEGVRDVREYGAVSAPPLKGGKWDPTNPHPNNPDFDPTYSSDVE